MSNGADGQLQIGNGYTSAVLNDEGMQIYHNSSSRGIIFGINESEKTSHHTGNATFRELLLQHHLFLHQDNSIVIS